MQMPRSLRKPGINLLGLIDNIMTAFACAGSSILDSLEHDKEVSLWRRLMGRNFR